MIANPSERDSLLEPPPVVVGGVGGGGTRVLSQLLNALGFALGPVSTPSLDNVLFTALFTIPAVAAAPRTFFELDALFVRRNDWWDIFAKATRGAALSAEDLQRVERLIEGSLVPGLTRSERLSEPRKADLLGRVHSALAHCRALTPNGRGAEQWGWKEPNSSIFLPQIARRFPGMAYIHVIRHGLDMAYSSNTNQLVNWGLLFAIKMQDGPDAESSLEFWVKTNERTIAIAEEMLGSRFLIVNFDDLVRNPGPAVSRLCSFLGVAVDGPLLQRLAAIPSAPRSLGRYKVHDYTNFAGNLLAKVRAFGFDVPDTDLGGTHSTRDIVS